jgi:hypothetical protein
MQDVIDPRLIREWAVWERERERRRDPLWLSAITTWPEPGEKAGPGKWQETGRANGDRAST